MKLVAVIFDVWRPASPRFPVILALAVSTVLLATPGEAGSRCTSTPATLENIDDGTGDGGRNSIDAAAQGSAVELADNGDSDGSQTILRRKEDGMHSRPSAGWKAVICAVAMFVLLIPAGVIAGGRHDGDAIYDWTAGSLQRAQRVAEEATISVDRYPRGNYSWPFVVDPHYGKLGILDVRTPGVLHTQIGSFELSSGQMNLPVALMTTNKSALGGEVLYQMPVSAWVARLTPAANRAVQGTVGLMAIEPLHPGLKFDPGIGRLPLPDPVRAQGGFSHGQLVAAAALGNGQKAVDTRFSTLEDLYGKTGNSFQGALTFINFESNVTTAPVAGYGHGVDDVVVQWREFRLDTDTTDCAINGRCATLDLKTLNFYEGSALFEITATETTPYGLRCNNSGSCTVSGVACTIDGDCGAAGGNCENDGCDGDGDCHGGGVGVCVASFNDCDGNDHFFDTGDDDDCDDDGIRDLRVRAFSEVETAGEFVLLQETSPSSGQWFGELPISSRADVDGTLFVAQIGTDIPTVQVSYQDIDVLPGAPQEICRNSIDPAAQGEIRVATLVLLQVGKVVLTATRLRDSLPGSGDGDPFADADETLDIEIFVSNKTGVAVTGLRANMASNDPNIECVTDTTINFGDMAVGEERGSGGDVFTFKVRDTASRTTLDQNLAASFTVSLSSEQFDNTISPQVITIDLDLDASGGDTPTTFFEGFEGTFGTFTSMHLDAGHGGSATDGSDNVNSDGFRCQYSNPNWSQSNSYGTGAGQDCFLNPTGSPDFFNWSILPPSDGSARSFRGIGALYFGINIADNLGLTTPLAQIDAVRTINPFNIGIGTCSGDSAAACSSDTDCVGTCDVVVIDGFCDNAPNIDCTVDANCNFGTVCDALSPALTFKHQVSLIDSRTVNAPNGESADRGTIGLQLADPITGAPVGDWIKLDPIFNRYDQQGTDGYTNCLFDPIDDGNTEDDFFDPADPLRRLGPSSTCFPAFSFVYLGDTDNSFSPGNVGNASDPPGLCGGATGLGTTPPECQGTGLGTWVESRFGLERFRGRRMRARFLITGLKAGAGVDYETLFQPYNPDPGDDGWFIDDFTVTGTVVNPARLAPDLKVVDFGDSCSSGCLNIVGSLVAEDENGDEVALPVSLPVPGQVINLSGLNATAIGGCNSGPLEYKFCRDDNGSGACDPSDTLLRGFSDNPRLLTAPDVSATYLAEVRCSTDRDNAGCTSTLALGVTVGCPGGLGLMLADKPAPGSGSVDFRFPEARTIDVLTADAANSTALTPYASAFTNQLVTNTTTATFGDAAAVGSGTTRYYIAKKDGPPSNAFCNSADWGFATSTDRNVLPDIP